MGKSTISMVMFNSKPLNYQRVNPPSHPSQIVVLRIKKVVLSQKFLSGFHTTLPRPQSLTTTRLTRVPLEKKHTIFRVPIGFLDHLWSSMIISIHFAYWSIAVLALNHPENAENRYRRIIPAPTHHVGCLDEDALPLFLINGVVHLRRAHPSNSPKKTGWMVFNMCAPSLWSRMDEKSGHVWNGPTLEMCPKYVSQMVPNPNPPILMVMIRWS